MAARPIRLSDGAAPEAAPGASGERLPLPSPRLVAARRQAKPGRAAEARRLVAARRRAERAEQLARTLSQVAAARTLPAAAEALLRGAIRLLDGCHGVLRLFDPAHREIQFSIVLERTGPASFRAPRAAPYVGPPLPGSFAAALLAGAPASIVADRWTLDPATYPYMEEARRKGHRAAINVPVVAEGRRVGSLHVDHTRPGAFGPADLALAESLGALAGAVIERHRVEAALREEERQRARLEGALLVAQTAVHEVGNVLTPLAGYAELLALNRSVATNPTLTLYVAKIQEACLTLMDKVRQLRQLTRLEPSNVDYGAGYQLLDLDRSSAPVAREDKEHDLQRGA